MIAAASAIQFTSAPVPVEAGSDHLIDPQSIRIMHSELAIMPTQLNGRVAEMDEIIDIAENGLQVYEDSAKP